MPITLALVPIPTRIKLTLFLGVESILFVICSSIYNKLKKEKKETQIDKECTERTLFCNKNKYENSN